MSHEYNGWRYETEDNSTEDAHKIGHKAVHIETGTEISIRHTPYEGISLEVFKLYVALNFIERGDGHNWYNKTALEALKDKVEA